MVRTEYVHTRLLSSRLPVCTERIGNSKIPCPRVRTRRKCISLGQRIYISIRLWLPYSRYMLYTVHTTRFMLYRCTIGISENRLPYLFLYNIVIIIIITTHIIYDAHKQTFFYPPFSLQYTSSVQCLYYKTKTFPLHASVCNMHIIY